MTLLLDAAPAVRRDGDPHAERVQRALTSAHELSVGPLRAACDVREALGVGGDIVDLLEVRGCLLAVLADVSGKGSAASLVAAMLLASIQHHVVTVGARPGALLQAVEASMSGVLERTGTIATLAVVAVDPAACTVRLASAGHHPVLLRSQTGVAAVPSTCPPLGAAVPCGQELRMPFPAGSTLALVSDGITDQPDAVGRPFGLEGVSRVVASSRRDPRATVAEILAGVDRHAGPCAVFDDRSVLIVHAGAPR